jgi:hypothetical protein
VLDHIFVSAPLANAGANAVQYDVIHVNSEFANQVSDHDPQVVRIRPVPHTPPARKGTVTVNPAMIKSGATVTATLAGWDPSKPLSIAFDNTKVTTVTTNASGAATVKVTTPKTAAVGAHTISATASDGTTSSATLQVVKTCVPYPGPHATTAQYLLWLLAVLTKNAC